MTFSVFVLFCTLFICFCANSIWFVFLRLNRQILLFSILTPVQTTFSFFYQVGYSWFLMRLDLSVNCLTDMHHILAQPNWAMIKMMLFVNNPDYVGDTQARYNLYYLISSLSFSSSLLSICWSPASRPQAAWKAACERTARLLFLVTFQIAWP